MQELRNHRNETLNSQEKDLSNLFKAFPAERAINEEINASFEKNTNTNESTSTTGYEAHTLIRPLIEHKVKTNFKSIGILDVLGNYSLYLLLGIASVLMALAELVKALKN